MTTLTASVIQHACTDNINDNLERSAKLIREAAAQGAKLVVLQELHRSLYFCQTEELRVFDLAETIPGPSTDYFGKLAKELGIVLVISLFEKRMHGLYHNTAVALETDGTIAGIYRKMHIPDDPGFYEKFYFTPGDLGFQPITTSVGTLGILICWDQWFPEAARLMAMAGADYLIYPTAIGWDPNDSAEEKARQREAWITIQRSHSVANHLPVLSANRIGHENDPSENSKGIDFWGSSFITGSQGEILAETNTHSESVITAQLDRQHTEFNRKVWPYFRDRRIDAYSDLTKLSVNKNIMKHE